LLDHEISCDKHDVTKIFVFTEKYLWIYWHSNKPWEYNSSMLCRQTTANAIKFWTHLWCSSL